MNTMLTPTRELINSTMREILGDHCYRQVMQIAEEKAIQQAPVKVYQVIPRKAVK